MKRTFFFYTLVLLFPLHLWSQTNTTPDEEIEDEYFRFMIYGKKLSDNDTSKTVHEARITLSSSKTQGHQVTTIKGKAEIPFHLFDLNSWNKITVHKKDEYEVFTDYIVVREPNSNTRLPIYLEPIITDYILKISVKEGSLDGKPIDSITVSIQGNNFSTIVKTDSTGVFDVSIPFKEKSLEISTINNKGYQEKSKCYYHGNNSKNGEEALVLEKNLFPFKLTAKQKGSPNIRIPNLNINFISHSIGEVKTDSNGVLHLKNLREETYVFEVMKITGYEPLECIDHFKVIKASEDKPNEKIIWLTKEETQYININGKVILEDENGEAITPSNFYVQLSSNDTVQITLNNLGLYSKDIPFEIFKKNNSFFQLVIEHNDFEPFVKSYSITYTEGTLIPLRKTIDIIRPKREFKTHTYFLKGKIPKEQQVKFTYKRNGKKDEVIWVNPIAHEKRKTKFNLRGLVEFEELEIEYNKKGKCRRRKLKSSELKDSNSALKIKGKCKYTSRQNK